MSITAGTANALVAAVALGLAGCIGLRASDQPPPGFSLAGTWKLNPKLSTDTRAALQHLVRAKPRAQASNSEDDTADSATESGSDSGSGGDSGSATGHRRRSMYPQFNVNTGYPVDTSLQRSLLSGGDYLKIQQQPDEFVVWNGDTTNSYVPGEKSVVSVPSGVADQETGWKGKQYWIEIRPQVGPSVTEKFRLSDNGKQLIETIDIGSDGRVRALKVTRVYDPTNDVLQTPLPAGD